MTIRPNQSPDDDIAPRARKKVEPRCHLVIDADRYWFEEEPQVLSSSSAFFRRHPEAELTFLTHHSPWDACTRLNDHPFVLPHHLIASDGEDLLHLEGGDLDPPCLRQLLAVVEPRMHQGHLATKSTALVTEA